MFATPDSRGQLHVVEKSVWASGPDREGMFPAVQCGHLLSGEAASQQDNREASERGSSIRTL